MPTTDRTGAPSPVWNDFLCRLLENGSAEDQTKAFEFLSCQTQTTAEEAKQFLPAIQKSLLSSDPQIRYFARKARHNYARWFDHADVKTELANFDEKAGQLSTKDILLRKLRLGSRYVAFDAIERLTESRDSALADEFLTFLRSEPDPFKISYLLKRIGRIPDPRVPQAVSEWFSHPDPRIVANAVEGLWDLEVPLMKPHFASLAASPDNRIRANAVRALHKYAPDEAEQHLLEMLESNSIGLQDSAVFMLKVLRPRNLHKLCELALNSNFVSIRYRALEIPRPPEPTAAAPAAEGPAKSTTTKDIRGLFLALLSAGILNFSLAPHSPMFSLVMAAGSLLLLTFAARYERPLLVKIALSFVFFSLADGGRSALYTIPVFMVIWLGMGDSPTIMATKSHFFACLFAVFALLMSDLQVNRHVKLAEALQNLSIFFGKPRALIDLMLQQKRDYFGALFMVVSLIILVTISLDSWLPASTEKQKRLRYHLIILLGGSLAVLAAHLTHGFSLTALLATNGLTDPGHLIKFLTE